MGVLIALGIILLIIGIILFFVQRNQSQKVMSIRSARTGTVAELQQLAQEIAADIGSGSWQDYVKLAGRIHCDRPLISELKQEPCVHYRMEVTREYEEAVHKEDSDGKTYQDTERRSETVSSNKRTAPFELEDSTGRIQVNPDNADIDTVKVLDEFQQDQPGNATLSFGGVSLNLGSTQGNRRTIGYRYTEAILPLERQVLVVGMISDQTGELVLQQPQESSKRFMISLKTEAELLKSTAQSQQLAFYSMSACLGVGTLLLVIGLLR